MKLIMTIGPQGSGKSTWAESYIKENPNVLYLSTDKLRAEMGFGVADQSITPVIYNRIRQKTESAFRMCQDVLLDATFIKKLWRKDYIDLAIKFKSIKIAHVFNGSLSTLNDRVQKRKLDGGLFVPSDVIEKYIKMFQAPDKTEFDEIIYHK